MKLLHIDFPQCLLRSMIVLSFRCSARSERDAAASAACRTNRLARAAGWQIISCSSDNGRRNFCAADVRGGVQLLRQRSDSPCVFNRTWGFIQRTRHLGRSWLPRGLPIGYIGGGNGNPNWGGWDNGYNIYCASDDGRRTICPTDTRGGVQLARKRSDASCDFGRDWGYDRRGIWVDRGCRADFRIGGGGNGGGGGWPPGGGGLQMITCASEDMRRNSCRVNTSGGVRLVRQRSDADCILQSHLGI